MVYAYDQEQTHQNGSISHDEFVVSDITDDDSDDDEETCIIYSYIRVFNIASILYLFYIFYYNICKKIMPTFYIYYTFIIYLII